MSPPLATVVVVPRERFSFAEQSLENILARTRGPFDLLYVDGNSPLSVRAAIEREAGRHDFEIIRTSQYLAPNVARNLAARQVRTRYAVFIDNDVLVDPNWLQAVVDCAEETGAWAVGPLYCHGLPEATEIHMAAGKGRFIVQEGHRRFVEQHLYYGKQLADVRHELARCQSDTVEYHAVLIRMELFEQLGPLDEAFLSVHDHVDLSLMVTAAARPIYFEPSSLVTYVFPFPLAPSDRDYFVLRWCEAWNQISVDRFYEKWDLDADDPTREILLSFGWWHRQRRWGAWQKRMQAAGRQARLAELQPLIQPKECEQNLRRFPLHLCQPGGLFSGGRAAPAHHSPLTSAPSPSTSAPPAPYRSLVAA